MPMLALVNPRKRRARKSPKRARRARSRKSNPLTVASVRKVGRRRVRRGAAVSRRRRRNPISMRKFTAGGFTALLTQAAIGGAGAVGMDMLMSKVNQYLPDSLKPTADGSIGANALVRAVATVGLGVVLKKHTKGLSEKMAMGSLTVQMADIGRNLMAKHAPAAVAGVGYAVPNRVINSTARISSRSAGFAAYQRQGGASPLLSAYQRQGGGSPLLSSARLRDAMRV